MEGLQIHCECLFSPQWREPGGEESCFHVRSTDRGVEGEGSGRWGGVASNSSEGEEGQRDNQGGNAGGGEIFPPIQGACNKNNKKM